MPTRSAPSLAGEPVVRARPRAHCFDVCQSALDGNLARDRFSERTPTGVARADEQNLHRYASRHRLRSKSAHSLAASAAAIAPGRITRGERPVQSSTVDGFDGASVPASSTRNVPRATASPHCSRISAADVAGGTPGRFALVDVIASPCARMSRAITGWLVHRTATPPSGPRSRSGTRRSPPESTSVSGPGQCRATRFAA